jgi:beta-glucanase (GH16 family)
MASRLLIILSVVFFFACGDDTKPIDTEPTVIPEVTVWNANAARTKLNTSIVFFISLNQSIDKAVSFDYNLLNGTAVSPKDFQAKSGTLTIPANQTSANIEVIISGDPEDRRQNNLEFVLELTNPKFCKFAVSKATGTIITDEGSFLPTENTGYSTPSSYPDYKLAWNDEFNGAQLDQGSWNYEIGNGNNGWGNSELQYYTNNKKNVFLSSGNLVIEARQENIDGFKYSSARLTTKGKREFSSGRIDIRAKLPIGKGMWPALWMLGSNIGSVNWPACGEIDIMELIGSDPGRVFGTMHWKNANGSHAYEGSNIILSNGSFANEFHVFSIIWEKDKVRWLMDDKLFYTFTKSKVGTAYYPFNDAQFFIFNVAVGGQWPGSPDNSTVFPQRMYVDYIRVFQ